MRSNFRGYVATSLAVLALGVESVAVAAEETDAEEVSTSSWGSINTVVVTAKRDGYSLHDTSSATRTNTPLINVP